MVDLLLREDGDGVLAIGQASHAWISGQLARAWGNERFGAVEPYEAVCLAAEQHDVGMARWDLRPTLNLDTGLPHSFLEMPLRTHIELWSAGPERLLSQSRYAALLVSMHGWRLYRRRDLEKLSPEEAELVRAFLRGREAFQERLRADLPDRELEARNSQLIWIWDYISLALCLEWMPCTARKVPTAGEPLEVEITRRPGGGVTVDPWPFARGSLVVRCEGRRLEGRFRSEEELQTGFDAAPWQELSFELVAPGG